jgi:hypothetical protein
MGAPSRGSRLGWDWSASAVKSFSAGALLDAHQNAVSLNCTAQGFDPASRRAAGQIASVFALCTSATFPGADPSTAARWVAAQEALILADLRARPHVTAILSATPRFGTAVYWLRAQYNAGYGITFQVNVT